MGIINDQVGPNIITAVLIRETQCDPRERRHGNAVRLSEYSQELRNAGSLWNLAREENAISPRAKQKNTALLVLVPISSLLVHWGKQQIMFQCTFVYDFILQ